MGLFVHLVCLHFYLTEKHKCHQGELERSFVFFQFVVTCDPSWRCACKEYDKNAPILISKGTSGLQ